MAGTIQSSINTMIGTVAGATFGIKKTLQQRQEEANKKVEQQRLAKKQQKTRFRKSILLDAQGQNIMVPIQPQQKKEEPKKSILLDASGRNLTDGNK